jgi:hypothetical protein
MTQLAKVRAHTLYGDAEDLTAIIVGTGRCGSTMLSNILGTHPAVLSLSEFFATLRPPLFQEGILDAAAFWEILSTPNARVNVLLNAGISIPEILYPGDVSSRFTYESGIPPVLLVTLPHLTRDYEALFDELHTVVSGFPPDHVTGHYMRLFSWLKQRFGRKVCIERSGASLSLLPELVALFPRTKFVHLIRDGRGCIWSMYRHPGFRMAAFFEGGWAMSQDGENDDGAKEAFTFDPARIIASPIPFEAFGKLWMRTLVVGLQTLVRLPQERVLTVRYEDIIANPRQGIEDIIDFIDPSLHDEAWIQQASAVVKEPAMDWKKLTAAEREALERACQPGQTVLDLLAEEGLYSSRLAALLADLSEEYA